MFAYIGDIASRGYSINKKPARLKARGGFGLRAGPPHLQCLGHGVLDQNLVRSVLAEWGFQRAGQIHYAKFIT